MKDVIAKTLVVVCSQSVPTEFSGIYDYSWVTILLGNAHRTYSVNDSYKSRIVQSDQRIQTGFAKWFKWFIEKIWPKWAVKITYSLFHEQNMLKTKNKTFSVQTAVSRI